MYDIEVIDGRNYAVIEAGSSAYEFLKAMNSRLTMKKLASEPGEKIFLTVPEMASLNRAFKRADYPRLVHVGLIEYDRGRQWDPKMQNFSSVESYTFTEYGLEIMKDIKTYGEDVEIRLN